MSDWRYHYADERGTTIATADPSGALTSIDTYDEYGRPSNTANPPSFKYTGQLWLPEVGVYHYKARAYAPRLGRFLQTDLVGYDDQLDPGPWPLFAPSSGWRGRRRAPVCCH